MYRNHRVHLKSPDMKRNLIFGVVLMIGYGLVYGLGISGVDITLQVETKGIEKEQMASALCFSGLSAPSTEPYNLSGTLKLNLSSDSTALGISFQGLKKRLEVQMDDKGEGRVHFGTGWKRRSL